MKSYIEFVNEITSVRFIDDEDEQLEVPSEIYNAYYKLKKIFRTCTIVEEIDNNERKYSVVVMKPKDEDKIFLKYHIYKDRFIGNEIDFKTKKGKNIFDIAIPKIDDAVNYLLNPKEYGWVVDAGDFELFEGNVISKITNKKSYDVTNEEVDEFINKLKMDIIKNNKIIKIRGGQTCAYYGVLNNYKYKLESIRYTIGDLDGHFYIWNKGMMLNNKIMLTKWYTIKLFKELYNYWPNEFEWGDDLLHKKLKTNVDRDKYWINMVEKNKNDSVEIILYCCRSKYGNENLVSKKFEEKYKEIVRLQKDFELFEE